MKSILALALLVGVALSNSTDYLGWKPEKEFVYRFESELLTGVPKIKNQFAGLKLSSDVLIQSYSDYSLRIKFVDPRFVEVNDELVVREERDDVLVPQPRKELPEPLRKHLEAPFVVHLKRGVVESLYVERDEPVVVTNIKKALLSQLQLDLTASRRKETDPLNVNSVLKPTDLNEIEKEQQTSFFRTEESSLVGDCETEYTLHPLPEYQAQELEHQWRVEAEQDEQQQLQRRDSDSDSDSDDQSEAAKACKGKQYYQITKTNNFDNCRVRPVFNSWTGVGRILCDVSKSTCKDVMTHYQSSRYIVCGTPDEFVIRKIETDNSIISNPLSWDSEEKLMTQASVTLSLIKVKSGNFSPLPKPHDAKEKKSLIFEFPKQHQWSSEPKNEEEIVSSDSDESRSDYDIKPIFPMPDLKQSSSILPSVLSKDEIKQQVTQILKKVAEEFFSSPESCPTKLDVAGQISTVSKYLRPLNYDELMEVTREVLRSLSSQSAEQKKVGQEILADILSMIGTNPSVLIVKELIKEGKIEGSQSVHVLQNTIRNVRTPTKELLKEIFELVKSVKAKETRQLYTVGLLHLSNLVYKACVNPTTSETHYPVHLYGRFCEEDSSFITQEYIPYLAQQLEHSEKESDRLLYISALGKVGHKKILFPMVKAIEGKISKKPMARSLAVFSLKRLAKLEPASVRPLLLALIDNPAEKTEVRIAAVSILPWTQPSTAELQKIAVRSWFEPSKQVASFIFSTLEELTETEIPELKQVGLKAQGLKDLVKPFNYGVQFSQNSQTNVFVQYLKTAMNWRHSYTITEDSPIPARMQNSIRLYGGSWQGKGLTFTVYTQGMDQLVDKVLAYLDLDTEVSPKVDEELKRLTEKLQIKKESEKASESLVQFRMFGLERFYAVDSEMYREILEKVTEEIRSGSELFTSGKNFLKTMNFYGFNGEIMAPTASGFPVYVVRKMPFSIGVKGSVRAEGSIYKLEGAIKAKITPIVNIKMQTYMGAVSPFTKQLLVAGIEQSLHSSTPVEIKAEINRKGQLTTSIKTPEEIRQEVELLHVYTKPYTVVKSLNKIEPITKSSSLKEIVSGKPIQEYSSKIGQAAGIDAHVKIQGDLQIGDMSQMWEKIQQHNILSIASLGYMTPSFRSYSAKLSYNPASSMTKELKTRISIASAIRNSEDSESVQSWYPYGGEANDVKEIEHMCSESFEGEEEIRACQEQQLSEAERLTEQAETVCHQMEDDDDQNDRDDESEQEEQGEKQKCLKSVKVCEQAKKVCKESVRVQKQVERQMQQDDESFSAKKHMHKMLEQHEEQCQQKKEECESRVITLHKMRKMLNRQKHIKQTHAISVETGFGDDYTSNSKAAIQTVIALGGSRQENKYKYHAELLLKSPTQSLFEVEIEAQAELPEIRNRWNTKALLEEEIKMQSEVEIRYGSRGNKKQIVVKTDLIKTEQQKKNVQKSSEFVKCMEEERQGRPLASVCTKVRHQAASVDKVVLSVRMPESLRKSVAVSKVSSLIKAALLPQLIEEIYSQEQNQNDDDSESNSGSRQEDQIQIEARFNRTGHVMQLKLQHEQDQYRVKDIRIPELLQEIFPFSLRNGVVDRVHQLLTNDQEPASCRVDSHFVATFDNKTYDYKMNGCQHLLFADRSLVTPIAVLASGSKSSSEGKDVKIIAPKRIIELKSDKKSSVTIDGREEELSTGRTLIKVDSHGQPELELYRHHDGVIIVRVVSEDVKVLYDGRRVEIVAPRRIYSRACGICGDLNGDTTADLKTPEMCMLSEPRFVAYSYMLKDSTERRCEGVPSQDRQSYDQERRECVKERAIETPLRKLAEQTVSAKPLSRAHLVKEQLNQICISKEQLKVCGSGSNSRSEDAKPLKVKPVYVRFACMEKPSRMAEQMVNRAEAGELIDELLSMPTRFSTKEMEPVVCSDDLNALSGRDQDQDDQTEEDFNGIRGNNNYRNLRRKYNDNNQEDQDDDEDSRRNPAGRRTTTEEPWMNYPNSHRRYNAY